MLFFSVFEQCTLLVIDTGTSVCASFRNMRTEIGPLCVWFSGRRIANVFIARLLTSFSVDNRTLAVRIDPVRSGSSVIPNLASWVRSENRSAQDHLLTHVAVVPRSSHSLAGSRPEWFEWWVQGQRSLSPSDSCLLLLKNERLSSGGFVSIQVHIQWNCSGTPLRGTPLSFVLQHLYNDASTAPLIITTFAANILQQMAARLALDGSCSESRPSLCSLGGPNLQAFLLVQTSRICLGRHASQPKVNQHRQVTSALPVGC